jgi:hypothetical protein
MLKKTWSGHFLEADFVEYCLAGWSKTSTPNFVELLNAALPGFCLFIVSYVHISIWRAKQRYIFIDFAYIYVVLLA